VETAYLAKYSIHLTKWGISCFSCTKFKIGSRTLESPPTDSSTFKAVKNSRVLQLKNTHETVNNILQSQQKAIIVKATKPSYYHALKSLVVTSSSTPPWTAFDPNRRSQMIRHSPFPNIVSAIKNYYCTILRSDTEKYGLMRCLKLRNISIDY
jgi:hypothetical protein